MPHSRLRTPAAAAAFAWLAAFAGQCGDEAETTADPDRAAELEPVVMQGVELALRMPAGYFENRGPETTAKWGHLGFVEPDAEWGAERAGGGLHEATVAALERLRTTDALGFEWIDLPAWEKLPGCFPPALLALRESPRDPKLRGANWWVGRLALQAGWIAGTLSTFVV